jgi:hypothetical protein
MKTILTANCAECGTEFHGRIGQRFCGTKCQHKNAQKAWTRKNPEKAKEIERRKHEKNREGDAAYMKRWRAAHLEEQRAKSRAWHAKNGKAASEKRRQRRLDNPEEGAAWKESRRLHYYETRKRLPWITCLYGARSRAKKNGVAFSLTEDWVTARWTGRCEITNIQFNTEKIGFGSDLYSPSIDRIIPALGYTPENCRFVLNAVNAMKSMGTDQDVYKIAKAIVEFIPLSYETENLECIPPESENPCSA